MTNSNTPNHPTPRHDHRITAIKRWATYLDTEPPTKWAPQQTTVINAQLTAAQHAHLPPTHHRHVTQTATKLTDNTPNNDTTK